MVEEIEKRKWQMTISKSLAQVIYEKQLKGITNIAHTDWYKEIKMYWERVRDSSLIELQTVHKENLEVVQLKYSIANDFITFLTNLEKAKETQQRVNP